MIMKHIPGKVKHVAPAPQKKSQHARKSTLVVLPSMAKQSALSCPPKLREADSPLEMDVEPSFLQSLAEAFERTCKEPSSMSLDEY